MADIELVIKIPKNIYERIKYLEPNRSSNNLLDALMCSVQDGTPLPKGHGNLIDSSKIYKAIPAEEDNCTGIGMTLEEMDAYNDGIDAMYNLVRGVKPIIKADKSESEAQDDQDHSKAF